MNTARMQYALMVAAAREESLRQYDMGMMNRTRAAERRAVVDMLQWMIDDLATLKQLQ